MNETTIKNKIMNNRKQFAFEFAELLNKYLIRKYKKIPSANFFANQFNLRAKGTTTMDFPHYGRHRYSLIKHSGGNDGK